MWESAVDLLRVAIIGTAHLCAGSLGSAVLLVSFGVRLAMVPLTLRIARRARAQQLKLATLRPELESIKRRHQGDPARLMREMQALYRKHDVRLVSGIGIAGLLVQAPVLGALFSATRQGLGAKVRFLWVADLARPDALMALLVSALTGIVVAGSMHGAPSAGPGAPAALTMAVIVGVATLAFVWTASTAVALSVGGGALVSGVQGLLLARDRQREV